MITAKKLKKVSKKRNERIDRFRLKLAKKTYKEITQSCKRIAKEYGVTSFLFTENDYDEYHSPAIRSVLFGLLTENGFTVSTNEKKQLKVSWE